ncbi:sugar phosphate isomerase/epimerase family protein [Paenibacillus mendelii]|uniref:Sugar phosphate isomerase/epimerase family protein n=1 Tax=Paenibacillus mendelii TaxID=206163 RepID=A0ABV6JLU7_9BACL|nr:sugar phosphate isomerase/epimerase family protein [Paenibacillus mendelii]MCQ6560671.1 sugar phosphate isomerase/epimerase [Paenibacillus mendelii]
MVLNRLGVLTDEVSAHFEEALDWSAEQGLRHVEVRVINGTNVVELNDSQLLEVRRLVEERGLYISAVASPLFKCKLDPSRQAAHGDTFGQREESLDTHFVKLERVVEIAKLLGTNRIRIFSFWREENPSLYWGEIIRQLRKAAEIAERHGVVLLLENEPACNGGFAEEVADLVRGTGSPALKGLWDPGNEAYGGREAYPAGYAFMKDVLAHIHLKDAIIREDGTARCVPLGSGVVPVIAQLKALLADGYDGLFTLETHFIPEGGTQMTGTRMTLDALRALLKEV